MRFHTCVLAGALATAACSSPTTGPTPSPGSSSSGGSSSGASSSGSNSSSGGGAASGSGSGGAPATPTLVGDWLYKLPTGEDEIDMTSTSSGTAQLYWYGGSQAYWQVTADDSGSGTATVTLECTSSNCATADNIVYDCTYSLIALECTGLSGGMMNNYKGNEMTLTRQK